MNELVSIIIPIYNAEKSISDSINSILQQDYKNIEVILVDDGSKDNSLQICKDIAVTDARVKVIHTQNQGSGPARNTGIENASGRFAYFPDADDVLASNAVSTMVGAMKDGGVDLVVFGFKQIATRGNKVFQKKYSEAEFDAETLRQNYSECIGYTSKWAIQGAPWNKLFDMNVIMEHQIRYPSLRRHQDEGFIGRYMCYAKRVHFIPDVLYTYYMNDLKKEWQKYPVDYIDAVIGLNEVRQQTIVRWNLQDKKTQELINNEYICNVIKALELSFSPKMNFNKSERAKWILEQIKRTNIANAKVPSILGKYQMRIIDLIRLEKYNTLYFVLHMKIMVEKSALFSMLRG